jgi:hypothetical protein
MLNAITKTRKHEMKRGPDASLRKTKTWARMSSLLAASASSSSPRAGSSSGPLNGRGTGPGSASDGSIDHCLRPLACARGSGSAGPPLRACHATRDGGTRLPAARSGSGRRCGLRSFRSRSAALVFRRSAPGTGRPSLSACPARLRAPGPGSGRSPTRPR